MRICGLLPVVRKHLLLVLKAQVADELLLPQRIGRSYHFTTLKV